MRFLDGGNDAYPVEKLQADLEEVRRKVELRAQDTRPADMLLSEDPNGINPAVVWGLVQLMLGGLPTRHVGVPWHCAVRYFDAERRRAGIPPGVASLVDHMSADEVGVQLVNLDPVHAKNLVLQSGAFAEHTIDSVAIDGERTEVGAPPCTYAWSPAPERGCCSASSASSISRRSPSPGPREIPRVPPHPCSRPKRSFHVRQSSGYRSRLRESSSTFCPSSRSLTMASSGSTSKSTATKSARTPVHSFPQSSGLTLQEKRNRRCFLIPYYRAYGSSTETEPALYKCSATASCTTGRKQFPKTTIHVITY